MVYRSEAVLYGCDRIGNYEDTYFQQRDRSAAYKVYREFFGECLYRYYVIIEDAAAHPNPDV